MAAVSMHLEFFCLDAGCSMMLMEVEDPSKACLCSSLPADLTHALKEPSFRGLVTNTAVSIHEVFAGKDFVSGLHVFPFLYLLLLCC